MGTIYVTTGQGDQQGPFPPEQVQAMWREGKLPPGSLYWQQGMNDWRPIQELPGIVAPTAGAPLPHLGLSATALGANVVRHAYDYDPAGTVRALVPMIWGYAGCIGLSLVGRLWKETQHGARGPADVFLGFVALATLVVYLVTAVVFCRWIIRAGVNLRGFGATGFENTPGWAVGWFFVPFANLWKPFQAMREIWLASADPQGWHTAAQATPPVVGRWWALWLLTGILGWVSSLVAIRMLNAHSILPLLCTVAADLCGAALCYAAVQLVTGVQSLQDAWVSRGDGATVAAGPLWAGYR